jgi:hypothetical protein
MPGFVISGIESSGFVTGALGSYCKFCERNERIMRSCVRPRVSTIQRIYMKFGLRFYTKSCAVNVVLDRIYPIKFLLHMKLNRTYRFSQK